MASRWVMAGTGIGLSAVIVVAAYGIRQLIGGATAPIDSELLLMVAALATLWLVQPLLLPARSIAPSPSPSRAPDEPMSAVTYEVTEEQWLHGKLLYRGTHTLAGMGWRFARTVPWVLFVYGLFALLSHDVPRGAFLRDPVNAVLVVATLAAVRVLVDDLYSAPFAAARSFRANRQLWWPARLGWNTAAIFISNGEGRFRYPLDECRGWKEDEALILLFTADDRYWVLPKQPLADAGRLDSFVQLLRQRIALMSPYRVLYRRWLRVGRTAPSGR